MARSKQSTAEAVTDTPTTFDVAPLREAGPPQPPEAPRPGAEHPAEKLSGPLLPDPFAFKTVNAGGSKVQFQHSRQAREFQIRFGDGGRDAMPSESVREFIKSYKTQAKTRDGEVKEVQLFHWNDHDRAWGMRIPHDRDATPQQNEEAREKARVKAKAVYDEVVKLVAADRGAAPEASR